MSRPHRDSLRPREGQHAPGARQARRTGLTRLTRARIVLGAITLIDARGRSGLSMRALGQALGTSAMALYFHFPGKEDVLAAVGRALLAEAPALEPASWKALGPLLPPRALAARLLGELRGLASAHPAAWSLVRDELSRDTYRTAWRAGFDTLSPERAELLRVVLVAIATEPPSLDAELLTLFFA